ncbi:MAG: metal ABC transporter permease, partial [Burkholderiales bacterium]
MNAWWILVPVLALGAALLALAPLGTHVLRRGVVFIDLAIAQSAAAGALAALSLGRHPAWWVTQTAAILSALVAAGVVALLARRWP